MSRPKYWEGSVKEAAIETIIERIKEGESLRNILSDKRDKENLPSRKLFNEWLRYDSYLSDQYARACMERADAIFEDILEIADETEKDYIQKDGHQVVNNEAIQRSRLRVDARKWVASKLNPKKYGDNTKQEQSLDEETKELDHKERSLRIEALQKKLKNIE